MASAHDKRIQRILRKQRNADKKVSRIEGNGIRIRNTSENPHRTPTEIRNMSSAELASHERRLSSFTSRSNQYLPGQDNQAIRRSSAAQYERLQAQVQARTARIESQLRGLKLAGSDTTIGQMLDIREKVSGRRGNANSRILTAPDRKISQITGEDSIQALMKDLKNKQSSDYYFQKIEAGLNSIKTALNYSGQGKFVEQIEALSPLEQHLLIDYSRFEAIAALNIQSPKYNADGTIREDFNEEEYNGRDLQDDEELSNSLQEVINWVRENVKSAARSAGLGNRKRNK